jgi:toxin ParE1/3/4
MPDKLLIRYLPIAQDDLIGIYDWIAKDSPSRASSFVKNIDMRIGALAHSPNLGRIPRHPRLKEFGYSVLILDAYLVFYIIRGQTIEIHRVIHGSRNLNHLI